MKSYSEWDLLVISNDVEVGDTLSVETCQKAESMIFIRENKQTITLVDKKGTEKLFKKSTLEGFGGPGFILCKAPVQYKMADLKRVG